MAVPVLLPPLPRRRPGFHSIRYKWLLHQDALRLLQLPRDSCRSISAGWLQAGFSLPLKPMPSHVGHPRRGQGRCATRMLQRPGGTSAAVRAPSSARGGRSAAVARGVGCADHRRDSGCVTPLLCPFVPYETGVQQYQSHRVEAYGITGSVKGHGNSFSGSFHGP